MDLRYPRPQMVRGNYKLLDDGEWTLNGEAICVPYPPEASDSKYKGEIKNPLCYETRFSIPKEYFGNRILLHFGAVDQVAEIYVNDVFIGKHEQGYLSFTCDITDVVDESNAESNTLKVIATDTLDRKYPRGKQSKKSSGMWYTKVSGIWQSVWLESVPENFVEALHITSDKKGVTIVADASEEYSIENIRVEIYPATDFSSMLMTQCGWYTNGDLFGVPSASLVNENIEPIMDVSEPSNTIDIDIENPVLWSVENPYIYPVRIYAGDDVVDSYFALREIAVDDSAEGKLLKLNGQNIFLNGVLDQGYFTDGIFLPKEPEEYIRDVLRMKELGFNFLRKHIKLEPQCFYTVCDLVGMFVMQDMINNGDYKFIKDTVLPTIGFTKRDDTKHFDKDVERKDIFIDSMLGIIDEVYNHPSLVAYTIFNEGWGQFESDSMYALCKHMDANRLIDSTSGWFWQNDSDFDSLHIYFRNEKLEPRKERLMLLSECGGYQYGIEGHKFQLKRHYGYGRVSTSKEDLTMRIRQMYEEMVFPAIKKGLCGVVFTQLSDVEEEINGLYTYDREICKVIPEEMRKLSKELQEMVDSLC